MRILSMKLSRQAVFRSPRSLQTQSCTVTQQPATGSASQQYVSTFLSVGRAEPLEISSQTFQPGHHPLVERAGKFKNGYEGVCGW